MEPLGTISKYYAFIDEETQSILNAVMKDAENYRDFVVRLGERVVNEKLSPMLAYFAVRHAGSLNIFDVIDKIHEFYGDIDIISPWVLASYYPRGQTKTPSQAVQAIDNLLDGQIDEWLIIEMHDLKASLLCDSMSGWSEILEIVNKALELVNNQEELQCFLPSLLVVNSDCVYHLRTAKEALVYAKKAQELSREFNDSLNEARALREMAETMKNNDAKKAISFAKEARRIFVTLGDRIGIGKVLYTLGIISEILGDYDNAIDYLSECAEINEREGVEPIASLVVLSRVYVKSGQELKAIECLENVFSKFKGQQVGYSIVAHFVSAEAYALCGQMDEACVHLDDGLELLALQKEKWWFSIYYSARGVVERERGDLSSAILSFRRALSISELHQFLVFTIRNFILLAEVEVLLFSRTGELKDLESAQLILSRLEQLAREQNFVEIMIEVAILKAELYKAANKTNSAQIILEKALELAKSSDKKSARVRVVQSLDRLHTNESTTEIAGRFSSQIRSLAVPTVQAVDIQFSILGCIVMLREGGLEIYSKYISEKLISDPSMVAGLISAVSTFAAGLKEDSRGELQSIVHQDIAVLLEHGQHVTCALLSNKDTYNARVLQQRFLNQFEKEFSFALAKFDGAIDKFNPADQFFESIFMEEISSQNIDATSLS
ncbi:MAG: tetratricopeptide repeat protein [Candidatus Thorarchaeota archaeon]